MAESRNVVEPATADRNRATGGLTFNAFPPDDYEGNALVWTALRLGDHAHVYVESGRCVPSPLGDRPHISGGYAGHLVLRWPEWLLLRETLDADPRYRIAEVESPSRRTLDYYAEKVAS